MSDWVSVEDKLPEAEQTVLIYTSTNQIYTCRKPVIDRKNSEPDGELFVRERVTHWMPLPEPPNN